LELLLQDEAEKSEAVYRRCIAAELKSQQLAEQLTAANSFAVELQSENQQLKTRCATVIAAKCTLELREDQLSGQIRVLDATTEELRAQCEEHAEELVFAQGDLEVLREELKGKDEELRQANLEQTMYRTEAEQLRTVVAAHEEELVRGRETSGVVTGGNLSEANSPLHPTDMTGKSNPTAPAGVQKDAEHTKYECCCIQ